MNSIDFLSETVVPNSDALSENPGDIRMAVNAILTVDAFFGIFFEEQRSVGVSDHADDEKYRNYVVQKSECYAVLRDVAAAIKHGRLDKGNKLRVVRKADQTKARETVWSDHAMWSDKEIWVDSAVIIETESGERVRADGLVKEVALVAEEELKPTGRSPATLVDILSVLG